MTVPVPHTVLRAAPRSFCAGVERTIEIVEHAWRQRGRLVYVRAQVVENAHVADPGAWSAVFFDEQTEVPQGLTAGVSAPPRPVDEVVVALDAVTVRERATATESIRCTLPAAVRAL